MSQFELNVSEVTGRAWELSKKQGIIVAVLLFGAGMVSSTISTFGFPWIDYFEAISENDAYALERMAYKMGGYNALSFISGIVSAIISAGILKGVLNITSGKEQQFDLSAFKMPVGTYVHYVLAHFVTTLIIAIGTMFCIVPGIYLATRLCFVTTHILERPEDGFGKAFEYSWNITKGNFWNLFCLGITYCAICIAGLLCCCIGVYFAGAMGLFMLAVAYFTLSANAPQPNGFTPEGTQNTDNTSSTATYYGDSYQQKY